MQKKQNIENISKLALLAFKTEDIYVAYDMLHSYYRDKIGRDFPLRIEELEKEKKIAQELLNDLIVQTKIVDNELSNPPIWFNLDEFKRTLKTAYQNLNFETAFIEFKERWSIINNLEFPFPLWDCVDEYMLIMHDLNVIIIENCLLQPKSIIRVTKTEIKQKYKWSEDMFRIFYP